MSSGDMTWAAELHRLWRAVTGITDLDELTDLVLPVARALPGVTAAEIRDTGLVVTQDGTAGERVRQVAEVTREALALIAVRRATEEQQVRDALLAEASLRMDAVLDIEQTLQRVARMAVPAVAEGCLVYVTENDRVRLRTSVHVDMRRLGRLLADPAVVERLQTVASDAVAGRTPGAVAAPDGARAIDVQVLRARGRVIGALVLLFEREASRVPGAAFLRDLAYRAALAIDNGELYERRRLEVAAMQQHLLPRSLPAVPGVAMAASYTVGDRVTEVGGDFYDVVPRADGTTCALIGDVCGRGVDAAALTGMARHTLGSLLHEGVSPGRALARLNDGLRRNASWRFVTAGVGLLRPVAGGLNVQWSSCGHPPPLVLRAGGAAGKARGGGVPLGILPQARVGRSRLFLGYGDTLILFTDGLTESRDPDGRLFEDAGLPQALKDLNDAPLDELVRELGAAAAAFGSAAADDIAVLAVRPTSPEEVHP